MLVLATLFLCVLGALGAPHSDRLGPAIGVPAPHIHQRQSLTNVSGPVVNFTETTPVMPSTEPRASTLASAAKVGPSTAASIQTQVSANTNLSVPGGNFSRPQEGVTWTTGQDNSAQWTPFNFTVEVWLTNAERDLLPQDRLVATVPPMTFSLLAKLSSNGTSTGKDYTLYLTPVDNSTVLGTSAPFSVEVQRGVFASDPETELRKGHAGRLLPTRIVLAALVIAASLAAL